MVQYKHSPSTSCAFIVPLTYPSRLLFSWTPFVEPPLSVVMMEARQCCLQKPRKPVFPAASPSTVRGALSDGQQVPLLVPVRPGGGGKEETPLQGQTLCGPPQDHLSFNRLDHQVILLAAGLWAHFLSFF